MLEKFRQQTPVSVVKFPLKFSAMAVRGISILGDGYLIYLSKQNLAKDQPFDFYCEDCTGRYFPEVKKGQNGSKNTTARPNSCN